MRNVAGLTPDLRIMDLLDAQPEFTKSFWDYLDLLVSDERIANGRAILAQAPRDLRRGREGLRRRPPHHRRDLGRGIQLRHHDRRPLGDPLDRDARLHRPPPGLLPRGISLGAGNPRARRRARPTISRAPGRAPSARPSSCRPRSSAIAVDFDGDGRRDVVDSVPDLIASTANNLKKDGWVRGPDLGLRGRACRRASISCSPTARA